MEKEIYWLWLQGVLGYNNKMSRRLIEYFGDAEAVYKADGAELKKAGLTRVKIGQLENKNLDDYYDTLDFCRSHKIHIITPDSEYYPKRLLEIDSLPLVLYVRGDYRCLNCEESVAVIGSRTPSAYGEEAADKIVGGLCEKGAVIVSGGALGIDTIAHRSAINHGGKTVLVMGCGHGSGYLPENRDLRKSVAGHGALITEYPPFYGVTQATFPARNRIISGMCRSVVIAEAASFSGTFSTARHAIRQGRELYVLPGDINSGNFEGSNKLIVEGARPVFSADDIFSYRRKSVYVEKSGNPFEGIFEEASSYKRKKGGRKPSSKKEEAVFVADEKNQPEKEKNIPESISKNAGIVYNIMSDGICDFDSVVRRSGLPVGKVLTALTELEMKGCVKPDGPGRYSLI